MLARGTPPGRSSTLDATEILSGEAALLFGPAAPDGLDRALLSLNLSVRGDRRHRDHRGTGGVEPAQVAEEVGGRLREVAALKNSHRPRNRSPGRRVEGV
jgi:hypothetical protein